LKIFREPVAPRGQIFLLPPSVEDYVPGDSAVRIVSEIVDSMDHSGLYAKYTGGGAPAYDPKIMLKLIVFGYSQGVRSSRRIDAASGQDMRFMFLSEMSHPDFRTISRFRKENLEAVNISFRETVRISMEMGLALLEHCSVDGTKLEANVSGKETYSKDRLEKTLELIDKRIAQILEEADRIEEEEDALYGDARGDELPSELKDAIARKKRLEAAKKAMDEAGRHTVGATDTDSRLMKTRSGNKAAYNGQAVVDKENQVIVAADVVQDETDNRQYAPMMDDVKANTGAKPEKTSGDGGYFSTESIEYAANEGIDAYIPDTSPKKCPREGFVYEEERDAYICPEGKALTLCGERVNKGLEYRIYRCYRCTGCPRAEACHGKSSRYKEITRRVDDHLQQAMSAKMKSEEGRSVYRLRKQIVEPVFGNIKANMGMRRLLLRGLEGAKIEYLLACTAHNIGKIARYWIQEKALMIAG